jgi:hypothetical protein
MLPPAHAQTVNPAAAAGWELRWKWHFQMWLIPENSITGCDASHVLGRVTMHASQAPHEALPSLGPLCVHDRITHVFNTMFAMVNIMCTDQVHIMDQPELGRGEGPIGVVVAPTRELAEQIHKETRKFSRVYSEWW